MKFLLEQLRRQPRWLTLGEALALIVVIGWIDYITGWEWSFIMLYALPILLVVWKTEPRLGFAAAFLCAIAWWLAQAENHPYHTQLAFALAIAGRLFYFCVLVLAAAAVKYQRAHDHSRIELLEREQAHEREVLSACEREQQRIGRDLHDNLGPHLAAIGYAATFLANELRERDRPESARAEQIRVLVAEAVSLTRDLARGISPFHLDGSGLSIALEDLARTVSSLSGLSISFHETGEANVENAEDGLHLYRIAQEAVTNAAKHGEARKVTIVLCKDGDVLRLTVADDGKGLAATPAEARGMGMHSMAYRAQILGGTFRVDSRPEEGTVVSCELIPRPACAEAATS